MYIPKHFEETDTSVLHRLIQAHPLGAIVTFAEGALAANHIPFVLHPDRGALGTLTGHVARANPLWKRHDSNVGALIIFQGIERFISPSWQPTKQISGKVVPTWNYVVVHAHGSIRVVEDPVWLRSHLDELTHEHEGPRPSPWKVDDAPADYIEKMIGAIVGIEITIARLEGKWKVSQNRTAEDRDGVIAGLLSEHEPAATEMATLVERFGPTAR